MWVKPGMRVQAGVAVPMVVTAMVGMLVAVSMLMIVAAIVGMLVIVAVVVGIIVVVFMAVIMVVGLERGAFAVVKAGRTRCIEQHDRIGVIGQSVDGIGQSRRQGRPHPEHHVGVIQRRGLRWAH